MLNELFFTDSLVNVRSRDYYESLFEEMNAGKVLELKTENYTLLISHGQENGHINGLNAILDYLTTPTRDNQNVMIVCCYAEEVRKVNPILNDYLLQTTGQVRLSIDYDTVLLYSDSE